MPNPSPISDAVQLLSFLQRKTLAPDKLSSHQRRIIVAYFLNEDSSWSDSAIGKLIGVSDTWVGKIRRDLIKKGVWELDYLNTSTIAVQFIRMKRQLQKRALEKEDWELAWKIEKEYIEKLQAMGFIYESPQKMEADVSVKQKTLLENLDIYFERHGTQTVEEFVVATGLLEQGQGGNGGNGGNGDGDGKHA